MPRCVPLPSPHNHTRKCVYDRTFPGLWVAFSSRNLSRKCWTWSNQALLPPVWTPKMVQPSTTPCCPQSCCRCGHSRGYSNQPGKLAGFGLGWLHALPITPAHACWLCSSCVQCLQPMRHARLTFPCCSTSLLTICLSSTHWLCALPCQVVGSQLCSRDLRHARLVCVAWATALAHSMPAVTVALPRQASERIFRQPLVLCSSGVLNSAQSRDYSAIPRQAPAHAPVLGRRRSCRHSHDGSSGSPRCSGACKRACTGSVCSGAHRLAAARSQTEPGFGPAAPPPQQQVEEAATSSSLAAAEAAAAAEAQQPVSRDKPSPFATEMGQAVLDCLLEDPLLAAGSKQVSCSTATAAPAAAAGTTSTATNSIPKLPRVSAIKAAISMPPTLAEQAAATRQQQAMQPDGQHMRKLSSLPASSARPVPRTRHVSKPAASQQQPQAPPAGPHHVVTTQGPAIQGWSSLPSAGLRTCSSLKQLHLKLSGAPPSPDDLLDLSKLLHLTHLSFKQVGCDFSSCCLTSMPAGCLAYQRSWPAHGREGLWPERGRD